MTGCLLISPNAYPVIIADTLTTSNDRFFKPHLPVETMTIGGISSLTPAVLKRKIYFFGKSSAIAISGNEFYIKKFLQDVEDNIIVAEMAERPMRLIGDIADDYAIRFGIENLSAMGVTVVRNGELNTISSMASGEKFTLPILSECAAIGSGRSEIRKLCEAFDCQLNSKNLESLPSFGQSFAQTMCNAQLVQEAFDFDGREKSWGGYLEHCHFDFRQDKWRMGPSSLSTFLVIMDLENGEFTLHMGGKHILYDPGHSHGRIMSLENTDKGWNIVDWVLEDILVPMHESEFLSTSAYWGYWKPSSIMLTVASNPSYLISHHSLTKEEMKEIIITINDSEIYIRVSQKFIDSVGNFFGNFLKRKYRPLNEIKIERS